MKKMILTAIMLMCMFLNATTYYAWTDGSAPENLNSWWTGSNGTGTHPANFTTAGDQFIVPFKTDGISMVMQASWTVTGTVIVEEGNNIYCPSGGVATLTVGALTARTSGTFSLGCPVIVNGVTYIYSSGVITLNGDNLNSKFNDVTINNGGTWDNRRIGTSSVEITGNLTNNSYFSNFLPGTMPYKFSGSGKTLSGSSAIPTVEFTGNYTNNGTLTCSTDLKVTGAAILLTNNGTITASTSLSGTGGIIQGATGVLNIGGTNAITVFNASTNAGNTVNYSGAAQTAKVRTYSNLILSGSGAKTFATTPTVDGILSLEGTASIEVTTGVVTYGSAATLQYNKSAAYTATLEEWISPFTATGGIIITNTGAITPPASRTIASGSMLTIKGGSSVVTNNISYSAGSSLKYEGSVSQTTTAIELPASMNGNVIINNTAGVILGGATSINSTLTFTAGNLTLGANDLTLGNSANGAAAGTCIVTNNTGAVRKFIEDGSSFTFPIGPTTAKYNPVTIKSNKPFSAGGEGAYYSALIKTISPAASVPDNSLNYMWTITGAAASTTLSFDWLNSDAGSGLVTDPLCGVAHNYTTGWTDAGGSTTLGTPNVTGDVVTSAPASNWTIGGNLAPYPGAGAGTSVSPYQVSAMSHLTWIGQNSTVWGRYFIQTANIDASSTNNKGEGWLPIGNSTKNFRGYYDGKGLYIDGLYINRSTTDYNGLFGYTLGGSISNLGLTDVNIQGYIHSGALLGFSDNTDIYKCYSTGTVSGYAVTGGLAGEIDNATVDQCYSLVSVTCSGGFFGGLAAVFKGTTVTNSYATGSVYGPAAQYAGGFVASLQPGSTIDNCYSTGAVTGTGSYVGGFMGANSGGDGFGVTASFWDTEASLLATSPAGGIGKTSAEMKTLSTFTSAGWDFVGETINGTNNYWNISSGNNSGYPYFIWQSFSITAPQNLTISNATANAQLSWTAVQGAASYKVYSSTDPYASFPSAWMLEASGVLTTSWTDLSAIGIKKFYAVAAVN